MYFEFFSQKQQINVLFQLVLSIYLDGSVNNTIGSIM